MTRGLMAWATIVVAIGISTVYVAGTFLYLSPPNPLTLQLWPVIDRIHQPFLVQNWHLFAPNPVRTNLVLAVRCRVGEQVTPWRDPFTPLLARHHQNRITPMGKIIRIPQNAMFSYLGRTGDEWRALFCRRIREHPACQGDDPAARRLRDLGRFLLQRASSARCDDIIGRGRANEVQARILIHTPPPWSKRQMGAESGSTRYIDLPWMTYMPPGSPRAEKGRAP